MVVKDPGRINDKSHLKYLVRNQDIPRTGSVGENMISISIGIHRLGINRIWRRLMTHKGMAGPFAGRLLRAIDRQTLYEQILLNIDLVS